MFPVNILEFIVVVALANRAEASTAFALVSEDESSHPADRRVTESAINNDGVELIVL